MRAVIKTGGKQYLVAEGDVLDIEKTPTKSNKVVFDEVLLLTEDDGKGIKVGDPLLKGAKVEADVIDEHKTDKVVVFKMRRRKNYRKKTGHRQQVLRVKIAKISA
ncbi:50S ribosomal protein L21 [Patescibacteria group bacterium]|nr:50S ribosomal protein L21 [Patescibacteria group bacterium]